MKYIVKNKYLSLFLGFFLISGLLLPTGLLSAQTSAKPLKVSTRTTAQNITASTATLEGSATPSGLTATVWFEWGPSSDGLIYRTNFQTIGRGNTSVSFMAGLSDLTPDSVYFFRAVGQTTNGVFYGSTENFKTKSTSQEKPSSGLSIFKTTSAGETKDGPLFMRVNISTDKIEVQKDETFVYNISYNNIGTADADNVILTVKLADGIRLDTAAPLCYGTTMKNELQFNLGRVSAGKSDAIGLRVQASSDASDGDELEIVATLQYESVDGTIKNKISDSLIATVSPENGKPVASVGATMTQSATLWFITSLILATLLLGHIYYTRKKIKIFLSD